LNSNSAGPVLRVAPDGCAQGNDLVESGAKGGVKDRVEDRVEISSPEYQSEKILPSMSSAVRTILSLSKAKSPGTA